MSVLFLTGAGISANAGIATYRDEGSSWVDSDLEKKSHANRYGNHLDELWDKHWGPTSQAMKNARPTEAHRLISEFQKVHPDTIVATQNIDDLHERAGSDNIAHLHGVMEAKCMRCKGPNVEPWSKGAPQCFDCGSRRTRPNVVLFGEMLNVKMFRGIEKFARTCTHIITVGTSLNVFPVAGIAMDNAERVTIINKQVTLWDKWVQAVHHEDCDEVLEEVLSSIDNVLRP